VPILSQLSITICGLYGNEVVICIPNGMIIPRGKEARGSKAAVLSRDEPENFK
jgi:hypothetical protein